MAIDDTGGNESEQVGSGSSALAGDERVAVGEYTWNDLRRDVHTGGRFDRSEYLGFDPTDITDRLEAGASAAKTLDREWDELIEAERSFVVKDRYTWEHFKQEYYYEGDGEIPQDSNGEK
ncbi:secretion system protein, partial [Halobacteriales archaeon QH_6_68_27]